MGDSVPSARSADLGGCRRVYLVTASLPTPRVLLQVDDDGRSDVAEVQPVELAVQNQVELGLGNQPGGVDLGLLPAEVAVARDLACRTQLAEGTAHRLGGQVRAPDEGGD